MSRKFARMVVVLLIVGVLVSLLPLTALAAPPGGGGPPGPAPAPGCVHVVRCGDTLWSISRRYGTTVWAIAQANGIRNVNCIRVGQVLTLPGCGHEDHGGDDHHGDGHIYIVQPGETLSGIAWKLRMSVHVLAQANHIWNYNLVYAYQKLIIP